MKNNIKKSASNFMWVMDWIGKFHPSIEPTEIWAHKDENVKWRSAVLLPIINKEVISISTTQVNAMKNVSDKAAKLIRDYIKEHPEVALPNKYLRKDCVFEETEDGEFISAGLSEKAFRSSEQKSMTVMEESLALVERTIKRLDTIAGKDRKTQIHTYDLSLFGDNPTRSEITQKLHGMMVKLYPNNFEGVNWTLHDNTVIALAYLGDLD